MSTISPNMGLTISTIGTDSGLMWEENLNASLNLVDTHNHSPGQGVPIQPNGLNITSDLPFQGNNATLVRSLRFSPQGSPIPNSGADIGALYVSGNELYYNDVTGGHQVQMTAGGTVNATSSGISSGNASAAFSGTTLVVKSSSTSYANVDVQSIVLANSGNLTNQLTLQAPSLSGSITETLPTPPASVTSIMQMDTSGNMSAAMTVDGTTIVNTANVLGVGAASIGPTQLVAQPITSAGQIGSGIITGTQIAAATVSPSNLTSTTSWFGATGGTMTINGGATATLITITSFVPLNTRPLWYSFSGNTLTPSNTGTILVPAGAIAQISLVAGLNTIATSCVDNSSGGATIALPISVLTQMHPGTNVGSTHTTVLSCKNNGTGTITFTQFQMQVFQV